MGHAAPRARTRLDFVENGLCLTYSCEVPLGRTAIAFRLIRKANGPQFAPAEDVGRLASIQKLLRLNMLKVRGT